MERVATWNVDTSCIEEKVACSSVVIDLSVVSITSQLMHELVRCYRNAPRSKIHFPEQLVQFHWKSDGFR